MTAENRVIFIDKQLFEQQSYYLSDVTDIGRLVCPIVGQDLG